MALRLVAILIFSSLSARAFETGTTFFWKLQGSIQKLPQGYDVYGLDLDAVERNPSIVRQIHQQGKRLICYFSAGTYENDRKPNRYDKYYHGPKGKRMPGWNERWLDIRRSDVRDAQVKILADAKRAGCDGVDPDNVDHSLHGDIGFETRITPSENKAYLQWLANQAHQSGLKIGLKNSVEFINSANLSEHFDFALNEQCFTYNECSELRAFSEQGKSVYIIEYKSTHESKAYPMRNFNRDCSFAKTHGFFFFIYKTQLVDGNLEETCWL